MDPQSTVTIEFQDVWDDSLMQTGHLRPAGSPAEMLVYTVAHPPDDAGMPDVVAAAIARALSAPGVVAGRWFDDTSPQDDTRFIGAGSGGIVERIMRGLTGERPAAVALTRSPQVVASLLDQGWWVQQQALLILDGEAGCDPGNALQDLRVRSEWTDFRFTPPACVLIAPGVDGDVALISAKTELWLRTCLQALRREFSEASFSIIEAAAP